MSGYADYYNTELYTDKYSHHNVPIIHATPDNFKEYGKIVYDYDTESVIITPWPVNGHRPLMPGTGSDGGITEGKFEYWHEGEYIHAKNMAVGGNYIIGRNVDNKYILTREANYHPDGGQVFWPIDKCPFILLLAKPGDNITPNDFVGFYFDGTYGAQIWPNIWHQPVYHIGRNNALYMTKQGKIHACVGLDTIIEWSTWLKLDLTQIPSSI